MSKYIVGVDVGGTKVAYGLFDERRSLVETLRLPSRRELPAPAFADNIIETIDALLQKRGAARSDLKGVGLCLPSFIDFSSQIVVSTANLPLLKDFAICDYMRRALGVPVLLDNDSNAAALAEYRYGAGKGARNMLYCAVGTGLGLGIILEGKIFRGDDGWSGESGHMVIGPDMQDYESHVAGSGITGLLVKKLKEGEKSVLSELCGGDLGTLSARHLLEAYRQGDALAKWGVEHMAHYLGLWTHSLYMTFNVNLYVFGGGLVYFGDELFGRARKTMESLGRVGPGVEFRMAELGENFGVMGAAELLYGA